MSLKHAANHLAAHGRGPDTELIHMTKGEINSLQHLAKANGGSLTINPHTGLAEAGFLSSILPAAIGAGAMYFSGGAINPATVGMLTGGLQYARTGSLQKGLMAGMGAYGGAGLAGGLMGAGASAMNTTAANAAQTANPQLMASEVGREMGQAGFVQPEIAANMNPATATAADKISLGASNLGNGAFTQQMGGGAGAMKAGLAAATPMLMAGAQQPQQPVGDNVMPQRLQYNAGRPTNAQGQTVTPPPDVPGYDDLGRDFGRQQSYFPNAGYQQITPEQAKQIRGYAVGGPVEQMSNANAVGANTGYPQADINKATYATPWQTPVSSNVVQGTADTGVNSMTGEQNEFAKGGLSSAAAHLGDYSDGGRLLKGPGDGVSDSIPATIGNKRPARLADGEFVVPARIVSELGNGSTEAGARKLYAMLDRVQAARKKSIGKGKVAKNSRADKLLPA
jgi:hypothetical protein